MKNIIGTDQTVTTEYSEQMAKTVYEMMTNTGSEFSEQTTPEGKKYLLCSEPSRDLVVFMNNNSPVSAYILKKA